MRFIYQQLRTPYRERPVCVDGLKNCCKITFLGLWILFKCGNIVGGFVVLHLALNSEQDSSCEQSNWKWNWTVFVVVHNAAWILLITIIVAIIISKVYCVPVLLSVPAIPVPPVPIPPGVTEPAVANRPHTDEYDFPFIRLLWIFICATMMTMTWYFFAFIVSNKCSLQVFRYGYGVYFVIENWLPMVLLTAVMCLQSLLCTTPHPQIATPEPSSQHPELNTIELES